MSKKYFKLIFHAFLFLLTINKNDASSVRLSQGPSQSPRIVNGEDAKPGEFPYIVSIRDGGFHICGGSVLDERYILTAAHCIYEKDTSSYTVLAGKLDISNTEYDGIELEDYLVHENYVNSYSYQNDIAILKLAKDLKLGANIRPVKLPPRGWTAQEGIDTLVAGWGHEKTNGHIQPILKKVALMTMSYENCVPYYNKQLIDEYHQCAFGQPGFAHCTGDSGGPLVITENHMLIGIVSFSKKPCGVAPGVYAKLPKYIDWIEEHRKF